MHFYNKTQADNIFSLKGDYATKAELNNVDIKYAPLLTTYNFVTSNGTIINSTTIANHVYDNENEFTIIWKILIISSLVLIALLFIFMAKTMFSP
jgi:hypothetical protein